MSEKCYKCMRPIETCYCKYIKPVYTDITFVFLMHPKEAKKQRTGTGRLASLSLPGSKIIVGVDFTENNELNTLLNNPEYLPLLLYPHKSALYADGTENAFHRSLGSVSEGKKLLLILIDSTWFFAKKILRLSKNLLPLEKVSFKNKYLSQYEFKTQPKDYCLSTIETCFYVIKEFQEASIVSTDCDPSPLMEIFKRMVNFQLQSERDRESQGIANRYSS